MKNRVCDSGTILYANSGSAIVSGAVVVMTNRIGIAVKDIAASTGTGIVATEGQFTLAKKSGDTFAQDAKVYWDASPGECTSTDTGNTLAGLAAEAAGSSATTMVVDINKAPIDIPA